MSETSRPNVIAAIPTWNMAKEVTDLLHPLREQGFDGIVVLDDNSQDDTPHRINQAFGNDVEVIPGLENIGAAGNRNRIIPAMGMLGVHADTLITFIDADTRLTQSDVPLAEAVRTVAQRHPHAGMIGGQVFNADGTWGAFNYGPLTSWEYYRGTLLQLKIENLSRKDPAAALKIRNANQNTLQSFPDIFNEPYTRSVGWLVETLTIIQGRIFRDVEGYDPRFRYCEAVDFGQKLQDHSLPRIFDPEVSVQHLQVDVRGAKRNREIAGAMARLAYKRLGRGLGR